MSTLGLATTAGAALFMAFLGAQDPGAPGGGVPPDAATTPGLVGSYWSLGEERKEFPLEVTCEEPGARRIDSAIDFDPGEGRNFGKPPWQEYFAVIWTGTIRLPTETEYTFYLRSHDPAKLYLDGALVVDHDGIHPEKEMESTTLRLTAGDHQIRVEHYQNRKEGRLILAWKYPGVDRRAVPATAFWHRPQAGVDPDMK